MARKYARGRHALYICGRCGQRGMYADSVFDGYYPNMRVHAECFEDKHPQERLVRVDDPVALWRPQPEFGGTPSALSGSINGSNLPRLTWTEAEMFNARFESYDIYRAVVTNGEPGDYALLVQLPITYDVYMAIISQTLVYVDTTALPGVLYSYYVFANASNGAGDPDGDFSQISNKVQLQSNGVSVLVTPQTGHLSITGNNPSITAQMGGNTIITPGAGTLSVSGYQPVVSGFAPLFVAGTPGLVSTPIMTSTDGINWTMRAAPNLVNDLAWSRSLKIFVSANTTMMSSPDGINWTSRTPAASAAWSGVAWSPSLGLFVSVASNGTNGVQTSTDGINWTLRTTPDRSWVCVAWSAVLGLFAAGSISGPDTQTIMTSPDGINWTLRTGTTSIGNKFPGYKMAADPTLGYFMCSTRSETEVLKSTDGITWTPIVVGVTGSAFSDVAMNGSGVDLMVTSSGTNFARSTNNGSSWAATASGRWGEDACYSPDLSLWVSTCASNADPGKRCIYSSDGNTWSDGSTPPAADAVGAWTSVIYANTGA